jgi:alkanesulfonate monooxygenase SsuD/methylene tetrahydromethanopterin reductase-like flavin-dependent oxidoreductase (luciferase family)
METWETYLVEHYRPGASLDHLKCAVRDVRRAAAEMARRSRPLRCVHCTIVPSDEAVLALFEAESEELVRELYAHAGIPFERIPGAVWLDAGEGMSSTALKRSDSLTSSKGAR